MYTREGQTILFLNLVTQLRYVYLFFNRMTPRDIDKQLCYFKRDNIAPPAPRQDICDMHVAHESIFMQGRNCVYIRWGSVIYKWCRVDTELVKYEDVPPRMFVVFDYNSNTTTQEIKFTTLDQKKEFTNTTVIWDNDYRYTITQEGIHIDNNTTHVEYTLRLISKPMSACIYHNRLYIVCECNEHESYLYSFKIYKWRLKSKLRNPKRQHFRQFLKVNSDLFGIYRKGYQKCLTYIRDLPIQ